MKILLFLLTVVSLMGCGSIQMYDGERLSSNQVAIIKPGKPSILSFAPHLTIIEINNKPVPKSVSFDVPSYEIKPGYQVIKAAHYDPGAADFIMRDKSTDKIVSFYAEGGGRYEIFYKWRDRKSSDDWFLYVKDINTGKIVSVK